MKKRFAKGLAAALCAVMAAAVFTGCGSPSKQETTGSAADQSQASEGQGQTPQIKKIVMSFPTAGVKPTDLGLVQDYINEISRERIGVEVELKTVSLFEAPSTIPMWIGGGEQLDLVFEAFSGTAAYVNQNMLEPMEDYLAEYAPYITKAHEDGFVSYSTNNTEHVYGINVGGYNGGADGGYIIAADDLTAAGLTYENNQHITLDDLDLIFEKIKEVKPDVYPCGVLGSAQRANMTFISDPLGATTASGVLVGLDSTTVVNYYETEEYQNYLRHARSWYEKGYILRDAATTDYSLSELTMNGTVCGYFNSPAEGLRVSQEIATGKPWINLVLLDNFSPAVSSAGGCYWSVPVTAKEPEAAVKFLNLLWEDEEVYNTLLNGIEGIHWVFTDKEKEVIGYPEGITAQTTTYAYGYGLFGDQRNQYGFGIPVDHEDMKAKAELAASRKTRGYGFDYDTSEMNNKIMAVQTVIEEYVRAFETGSADLNTAYPEFIQKMKANGIDEIIADKQAQFDEWLKLQ